MPPNTTWLLTPLCLLTLTGPALGGTPYLVTDIDATTLGAGSNPAELVPVNKAIFFRANDGLNGAELWRSDGSQAGTGLVADIFPGTDTLSGLPNSSTPTGLVDVAGTLFFAADDPAGGAELWRSDGTPASTSMIKDINPGGASSPTSLANVGGTLFFAANDGSNGMELWKSDGTESGTMMVQDIRSGNPASSPTYLLGVNGTVFFSANDGSTGTELWKSDGTVPGTALVLDIRNGRPGSNPTDFVDVNGTLFFVADDGSNGREVWKSDGTPGGTALLADINAGKFDANPSALTNVNNTLYFAADNSIDGVELWKSDGTVAGTALVKDIFAGGSSSPSSLTLAGVTLFFTANDGASGTELWKSDGTDAGTVMVKDIVAGSGSSGPQELASVNGTLFFTADDGTNGRELWKSDGTDTGTVMVADINVGTGSSSPQNLVNVKGALFFTADDGVHGRELWAWTRFDDVRLDHWAFDYIEAVAKAGITSGCSADDYCPDAVVTRAQMAVFLERGMKGSSYVPPPATGALFNDVGASDFAAAFIEQLANDGITAGCGAGNYCPDTAVDRAQMAVFLLRAKHGSAYSPPICTGTQFNDVTSSHYACNWIEQLANEGITSGCGGGNYCPDTSVDRAQMAVFLQRTFNLPVAE